MIKLLLLTVIASIAVTYAKGCGGSDSAAGYGDIVTYSKGDPIKFPDFEMTFTGERNQTSHFDNGNSFTFVYYDFKVKSGSEEKTVSWTSGTGEIGPVSFDIGGMKFSLILGYSEKDQKIIDRDKLVVTKL